MRESPSNWLDANRRVLAEFYPQFRSVQPVAVGRPQASAASEGVLQPFRDTRDLDLILDDLENEAEVLICAGTLIHDRECGRPHEAPPYLARVKHTHARYRVLAVAYPAPKHPRAFVESPHISQWNFPSHPHLNGDGSACSYFPSAGVLPRDGHTIRVLLDFTAIWLAKHVVWVDTGDGQGGVWIGQHACHTIQELLKSVPKNAECSCGSGKQYGNCCRPDHIERARAFDRIWAAIHSREAVNTNGLR